MSDYDNLEISTDGGAPYELYKFVTPSKSFYMTTDAIAHTYAGNVYSPVQGLKRSTLIINTHEDTDNSFSVSMPISVELAKTYALSVTPPSLRLTIYRFHRDATANAVYWDGEINSVTTRGQTCTFKATSDFATILNSNIPTLAIQPPCNNVLFDARCKVSRSANQLGVEVATASGSTVVLANIGSFSSTWFKGGECVFGVERRSIVSQAGTTLNLNYPFAVNPKPGDLVTVAAGCDHSYTGAGGCPKFANQVNFGGFPFAPGEDNNPFTQGV